jgi:hypothetical protein
VHNRQLVEHVALPAAGDVFAQLVGGLVAKQVQG